jgi:hypothetical protein
MFEKLLLSRKCWPRDVKLFENLENVYAEFMGRQLICRFHCLDTYSIHLVYGQITSFSGNVVFRNLMCSICICSHTTEPTTTLYFN